MLVVVKPIMQKWGKEKREGRREKSTAVLRWHASPGHTCKQPQGKHGP
jgi:hypothetical protein